MGRKTLHNAQAVTGLALILLVLLAAVFAPLLAPHDPEMVDILHKYQPAGPDYPLGTDQLGRCEFSRLLYGARYSIGISLPTVLVLSLIGLIVGSFSACAGAAPIG